MTTNRGPPVRLHLWGKAEDDAQHPARAVGGCTCYSKKCYSLGMFLRGELLHGVMLETGTTQSELSRISGVRQPLSLIHI